MSQLVTPLFKRPHHALGIVGPIGRLVRDQLIQAGLYDSQAFKIHGIEPQLPVFAIPYNPVGSKGKRAGKYMASVVIRMLSDQIHASRREIGPYPVFFPIQFLKLLNETLFHLLNLHLSLFAFMFSLHIPLI